ncbi:FixH family protein [Ideonella sp. BN130291]|uniref:FixH family protein n=1 Tax=Ideonella sp. BN130291 TaxID=3112940 RepID=UPI002E25BE07|nr:FixH family protein [Ideonella sp. BN130291]
MLRRHLVALLIVPLAGCMTPPQELDQSMTRATAQRHYVVAIRPLIEPIAINQMHSWEVKVSTPAGTPVQHAQIEVDGGMPQHGHGLPTQPKVTRELGDGRYLVEGMKFSMPGWWELKLQVRPAEGPVDGVTFNKVLELPKAARS